MASPRQAVDERSRKAAALRKLRLLSVASDLAVLAVLYVVLFQGNPTLFMIVAVIVVAGAGIVWTVFGRIIERIEGPEPAPPAST